MDAITHVWFDVPKQSLQTSACNRLENHLNVGLLHFVEGVHAWIGEAPKDAALEIQVLDPHPAMIGWQRQPIHDHAVQFHVHFMLCTARHTFFFIILRQSSESLSVLFSVSAPPSALELSGMHWPSTSQTMVPAH